MTSADVDAKHGEVSAGVDHRELEWQFTVTDLAAVRRWLEAHPTLDGWSIEARPTLHLQDTYFDTVDWRIFRSGFALRVRHAAGAAEATLKELRSASATQADRRELTEPVSEAGQRGLLELTGPVGTRVRAVVGTQELQPLFDVRTSRQRFALRRNDGTEDVGEIALDETIISRPDGTPQANLQRVEVEALTPKSEGLEELVDRLRRECTLTPATDSKFAVGLSSVGFAPPSSPQFGLDLANGAMRIDEVALVSLRRHLSAWIAHEPGARLGENPEALHDLRVAGRRLDATIGLFAAYLPASWQRMRPRLKMLMRAFGEVRDLDIARAALASFESELAEAERGALEPFKHYIQKQHARARVRLLRALDTSSTRRWFERLTHALVQPTASRGRRTQPLAIDVLAELVRKLYRKYRKAAERLSAESSTEDYHALRSRVKKLRYAIEAVASIYGKSADQFLRDLRPLQNRLGELQDAHLAQARLQTLVGQTRTEFPKETLFLMGRMAERQFALAAHARDRFDKTYRRLHRKSWKRLRRRLADVNRQSSEQEPADPDAEVTELQQTALPVPSV